MLEYTPVVWSQSKKNQIRLKRTATKLIQILIDIHIVQRNINKVRASTAGRRVGDTYPVKSIHEFRVKFDC